MLSRRQDRAAEWWHTFADTLADARDTATGRAHDVGGRLDDMSSEAQRRAVRAWAALAGKPERPPWMMIGAAAGAGFALGWLTAQAIRRRPEIQQALSEAEEAAQERAQAAMTAAGERVRQAKAASADLIDKAKSALPGDAAAKRAS
jgi:ElaB/YqjD/DUF883 family membrane-anchored ribosome-binding protein